MTDQILLIDFLSGKVEVPYLGKETLFLGLPHRISYLLKNFKDVNDPEASGHGTVHISRYHGGVVASNSDDPLPTKNIYFATKDGCLENTSEKLHYPDQLTPGKDYSVVFGGHFFDKNDKLQLVKLFYDSKNCVFETIYGDRFSIHNTYIVTPLEQLDVYTYNTKLQPFLQRDEYRFLDRPAYWSELTNFILKYEPPEFLDQCLQAYQDDLLGHTIIRCTDTEVVFPNYLKAFLGKHSPIYYKGIFGASGPESYHEITGSELKFIVDLMIVLVMRKQMVSVDKLIKTEINIDEWIHICDYFDIPYFENFFKQIREILAKYTD